MKTLKAGRHSKGGPPTRKRRRSVTNPTSLAGLPTDINTNIVYAGGETWAVYRVANTYPFNVTDPKTAAGIWSEIEQMATALPTRTAITSVCVRYSDTDLSYDMATMAQAVDTDIWRDYCDNVADFYAPSGWARVRFIMFRIDDAKQRRFGKPTPLDAAEAMTQGEDIVRSLGPVARLLVRADTEDVLRLYARAFRRHTETEPTWSDFEGGTTIERLVDCDITTRQRHLEIYQPDGTTNYVTSFIVAGLPPSLGTPGAAEWLNRYEQLPFAVDWTAVTTSTPNAEALKATTTKLKRVKGQFEEVAGHSQGIPHHVVEGIDALLYEQQALETGRANKLTTHYVFTVGDSDRARLDAKVGAVMGAMPNGYFLLERPAGSQIELICSGLPGNHAVPQRFTEFEQHTLPDGVAAAGPLCGKGLGDSRGIIAGYQPSGLHEPILIDLPLGPTVRPNPSPAIIGLIGKSGSGKTTLAKLLGVGLNAAGLANIIIDRSNEDGGTGEYVRLAETLGGQTISLDNPSITLDPLVNLDGTEAISAATEYLNILAAVDTPANPNHGIISEAVRHAHAIGGRLNDAIKYIDELGDEAKTLARTLHAYEVEPAAAQVLNASGEPISLTNPYCVFWAPDLPLPQPGMPAKAAELAGLGAFALMATTAENLLAKWPTFGALTLDECWALLETDAGQRLIRRTARDSRKRNIGMILSSQSASDIPPAIAAQFGYRIAFNVDAEGEGHTAAERHAATLAFLQAEPGSNVVDLLSSDGGGLGVLRDRQGRTGRIQTVLPGGAIGAAIDTTALAHTPQAAIES